MPIDSELEANIPNSQGKEMYLSLSNGSPSLGISSSCLRVWMAIHVYVLRYWYKIIYFNFNLTYLIKRARLFNSNS
jgi:hypothetical protein